MCSSFTSLNSLKIHQVKIFSLTNSSKGKHRIFSCNLFGWGFFVWLWLVSQELLCLLGGMFCDVVCLFVCLGVWMVVFGCVFWHFFFVYKPLKNIKNSGGQILKSLLLIGVLPVTPPRSVVHPFTQSKSLYIGNVSGISQAYYVNDQRWN